MRHFKLSLFNKLLGFLLLCLVCSGAVAVVLIRGQITHLAHEQMRVLFESDFRNVRAFLQAKADGLLAVARDLAKDELLKTGLELQVFDQVKNLAENRKTTLGLSEVMVINTQKRLVSRGDARRDTLDATVDAALANKALGGIEFGGRYQVFGQTTLSTPDGTLLARVVVMQPLSPAFFQELKAALGKDAMVFAGPREIGSTFATPPGSLQPRPVAPGLFTAFDQRFIGVERDLEDVWGGGAWRVVILQEAAPLVQSLHQVQWGSVVFVLLFMSLMALVLGLFFAANIRQPMRVIQQGIAALTQGNLATRIYLGRRDEWRLIEEALNGMTTSLTHHETALQHKVIEITALYEIGQEIAAQVDLKAILHLIVERARTLVDAEASLLALRHEASDALRMQAHSGPVPEALASLQLRTGEGLGGRIMATGMPVVVHDYLTEFGDSPFLAVVGEAGVRATVAVPLKTQGHVMGVLYVCSSVPNAFTEDHQQILSALADQTAIAMEKTTLYQQLSAHAAELELRVQERTAALAEANAEITALNAQLQAENLRMGAELDVTRKLQHMLLPTAEELRQIADLDIACYMEPAAEVGGDYYDVLQHNGLIKIGIGDVTGHGLESGVLMVMTQAIVRALLANGETDPVRFLDTVNRALYGNVQRMGTDKNLTLALLDYAAGDVRLSGQHETMLVVRSDGTVEIVNTIDLGFPVALTAEIAHFVQHTTVQLQPGDGVVLYTDGITEAENLAGQQYGLARLCSVVSQHWAAPAEVIKERVVKDVHQHIGAQRMYDDLTLVVVKRR